MIYSTVYNSPIGRLTMASDGENLIGLWIDGQKYFAETVAKCAAEKSLPIFGSTEKWLDEYFAGEIPDFTPPICFGEFSDFRKRVWKILLEIPYGKTTTYGEIAKNIAAKKGLEKMSAQAVGGAVGWNPLCIVVPCHRVLGSDGSLTGYGGGIKNKIALLKIEGIAAEKFTLPKSRKFM